MPLAGMEAHATFCELPLYPRASGYTRGEMSSTAPGRGHAGTGALARPPVFANRAEAGVALGARVREHLRQIQTAASQRAPADPVVLAIPRGGVAVAAGVARALGVPLQVLVVRKIGHPQGPELGLGAIAEVSGTSGRALRAEPIFDEEMLTQLGLTPADLEAVVVSERAELARRVAAYRGERRGADQRGDADGGTLQLAGRLALVVDDGLATGVTARAALRSAAAMGAAGTLLAVPVAAPAAVAAMENETGEVVTLVTPRRFHSVGEWYVDFGQLADNDVLTILASSGK
jgi:putative phosphoribosyl transferase